MRFCLNCGSSLPDAPVIVNFGGSQGGGSNPGTNPYGQSMETQFGGQRQQQFGGQQPQFQQPQQNYSMVPPSNKGGGGGGKKIFIAVAGVFALFFLILVAVAGIVGYNMMKKKEVVTVSPTPSASPSASVSPSASPSASKSSSPTPKSSETPKSTTNSNVTTKFQKVWVDYNVTEDGENGMRIHVKFQVTNMKDVDSKVMVYFQEEDGTNLTGSGLYSSDGKVAAKKELKPGFDVTEYKDLEIFMPYNELNLTKGKYNLKMDIDLADDDENLIQHLTFHEFQYEKF